MIATTSAPSGSTSLFPNHYSTTMLSTPRDAASPRTTPPSSSNNTKYACGSCIRGHRTSSCTHKDGSKGPLYPIRSKGRPPTQCEVCRQKRKESGRHVRCDCPSKKATPSKACSSTSGDERPNKKRRGNGEGRRSSDASSSSSSQEDNVLPPIRPGRREQSWSLPSIHDAQSEGEAFTPRRSSTLSLSSLMNPCGCRSTGSCICCTRRPPLSPKQTESGCKLNECDSNTCSCPSDTCRQPRPPTPAKDPGSSCCKSTSAAAPSIELLLQAVDMSTAFIPPPCACGPDCRCARCLAKTASSSSGDSTSPRTPPPALIGAGKEGCDDCAACDLALERPSGIGVVDRWMDEQRTSSVDAEKRKGIEAGVPTMHGGLLTSTETEGEEVRAELVLVHPSCKDCLEVVRRKGVGVLSAK